MKYGALNIALAACAALAQAPSPVYEAASVKPNRSASNGMGGMIGIKNGGGLSMRNIPVRVLLGIAYGIADYQISRLPAWAESAGYDIEAKPEKPVNEETAMLMFQNLLAERFHLRVHHQNATVPGFQLVVDKGGSKLPVSEAKGVGFRFMGPDKIEGPGTTSMLARVLKGILRAPVEDHTGLTGAYDVVVRWTPDNGAPAGFAAAEPAVSLFTAFKQQLGLSLEKVSVPIDMIVIDNVERPTEN